jgi:hypothetical protein
MISIFTVFSVGKVGGEIGNPLVEDVEVGEQVQGETIDRAVFDLSVSNGAILVNPTILVVLCIVRQRSKDLGTHTSNNATRRNTQLIRTYWDLQAHTHIIQLDL